MSARRRSGLVLTLALLAACAGGGGSPNAGSTSDGASSAASDVIAPTPTPTTVLTADQTVHSVGASFEYGAFLVTFGELVYDAKVQQASIGVRYTNLGAHWNQPEPRGRLTMDGVEHLVSGSSVDIPPRRHADLTITVPSLPNDPVLGHGTLRFGADDRNQPVVHLDDGTVEHGLLTTDLTLDGWAHIGKYTVHLTGAHLQAGNRDLNIQAPKGERVLRLDVDEYNNRADRVNGFAPNEHLTLRRPDGSVAVATGNSDFFGPISWTVSSDVWVEVPVSEQPTGDYQLLLSSISPISLAALHPELIERAPIAFTIGALPTGAPPTDPLPQPDLTPPGGPVTGEAFDEPLDVGVMNVPGFLFQPVRLRWDPTTRTARLDGDATYLQTVTDPATGPLTASPQWSFSQQLLSGRYAYTGVIEGDPTVPAGSPKRITIEFLGVNALDADDAGLLVGPRNTQASALPLGPASDLAAYPPNPEEQLIVAPAVVSGPWTVQLVSYRLGLIESLTPPPPGQRELEVTMDVSSAPDVEVGALGLSFVPAAQVFLAGPDGYMVQAFGDSGFVPSKPGETHRQSVTFHVPETFTAGRYAFVVRSREEAQDISGAPFIEVTFAADLGTVTEPVTAADQ
ncbi:MAG: hypothetical protein QOE63_685 [Acidimicrobiaceae bacterium]